MMHARGANSPHGAFIAASPALLALAIALAVPDWRMVFLALLLLEALLMSLFALPVAWKCLPGWQIAAFLFGLAVPLVLPLAPALLLLAGIRLLLPWWCRDRTEGEVQRLVPGFPLLDAALVAAAALATVSTW